MSTWYLAIQGRQEGPFSADQIKERLRARQIDSSTYGFTQGMDNWAPLSTRAEFADALAPAAVPAPPVTVAAPGAAAPGAAAPSAGAAPVGQHAHEIDYEIFGEEMQFVEITLDPQESCIAEAGAFMFMQPGIQMETVFGDGSGKDAGSGFMGKLLSAGKRVLTGESLFMTVFGNGGTSRQIVAFAAPYPGKIVAVDLRQHGGTLLCQKDAFLCAAKGVAVGIAFQKKLGVGFFGGEGFILQKLEGDGLAFVHACGTLVSKDLKAGETLRVDTGCLVAFESQVQYDIQMVSGVKTALFGGEGLFYAAMTGPGRVWLQSLPFSRLASRIFAAAPQAGGGRKEEGSVLGGIGGLILSGGGDR
jgi:uncharacterized protein (TIGR00266 family)